MIADIGLISISIAFLFSVYATLASFYGGWRNRTDWTESARNASILVFPLLSISVLVVIYSLYVMDFSLAYVAEFSAGQCRHFCG